MQRLSGSVEETSLGFTQQAECGGRGEGLHEMIVGGGVIYVGPWYCITKTTSSCCLGKNAS
jgi:hypothetical protein